MNSALQNIWRTAGDQRTIYVAVNFGVNMLFLVRGYIFMLVLSYRDLGLITLLQSIVMLLGILQFGVLNGGYRLLLSAGEAERDRIVNFVYSFIVVLSGVALLVAGVAALMLERSADGWMGILGVVGGAATLVRVWQTNQMIANGRFGLLNSINMGSALASLAVLGFSPVAPLAACMAAIVIQPVIFVVAAWFAKGADKPGRFALSLDLARRILATGFIIFLAGILLQVNIQLERWYVTAELGVGALGHLFVAIMVVTLLQLIPAALDVIFLPAAVRANTRQDGPAVARVMRTYFFLLLGYAAVTGLAIWYLAEPVLTLLAPSYVPDLRYVYLIAPGALALSVTSALALTFTVLIQYRFLLVAYAAGSLALAGVFALALFYGDELTLSQVAIARSAGLGLTAALVVAGWWILTRNRPAFRFRVKRADPN